MSRRAIISDIHSNLVALEAVLADIATQRVDEIVCLGDICGYGPQPIECIDRVRAIAAWTLLGNHDEALFVEPKDFGPNARAAVEWQRTILEPVPGSDPKAQERWQWIRSLHPQRQEGNVLFVHASPRDPLYQYVLREDFHDSGLGPTQTAKDIFGAMEWLCFCGHSHRPGVVAEDYKWWRPSELENMSATIKRGFKTIVNVGSVGQPRDGIPDACYVIFDYEPPADLSKTTQLALPPIAPTQGTVIKPRNEGTLIVTNPNSNGGNNPTPPPPPPPENDQDETRYGEEIGRAAKETARVLGGPKVTFRRVPYDVELEQSRFKAISQLPENNWARLARGV